eukprot:234643-Rhodomonas_salina.1
MSKRSRVDAEVDGIDVPLQCGDVEPVVRCLTADEKQELEGHRQEVRAANDALARAHCIHDSVEAALREAMQALEIAVQTSESPSSLSIAQAASLLKSGCLDSSPPSPGESRDGGS